MCFVGFYLNISMKSRRHSPRFRSNSLETRFSWCLHSSGTAVSFSSWCRRIPFLDWRTPIAIELPPSGDRDWPKVGKRVVVYEWGWCTHLLLVLVVWPLTTRPLQDGAPFLLLIETPSTFRHSLRFFHTLHRNLSHILSPSCFAVCGHYLSPSIAVVFSLFSKASNEVHIHSYIFAKCANDECLMRNPILQMMS